MKAFLKKIPGWVILIFAFLVLYSFGLHTEVIGQMQRAILFAGFHDMEAPEIVYQEASTGEAKKPDRATFTLRNLEGQNVSFDDFKGKVVFLNIWATWCPPCIAEMPDIQNLYNDLEDKDIAFVMLSIDRGSQEKVKKFIAKKGYTFPVYTAQNSIPDQFHAKVVPTTFILSKEGKIVVKKEGMASYNTPEFKEFLKDLSSK